MEDPGRKTSYLLYFEEARKAMGTVRQPPRGAKAGRLLSENRVTEIPGRIFTVLGDHDLYTVVLTDDPHRLDLCTCPWGHAAMMDPASSNCSHVIAAIAFSHRTDDPFTGLPK